MSSRTPSSESPRFRPPSPTRKRGFRNSRRSEYESLVIDFGDDFDVFPDWTAVELRSPFRTLTAESARHLRTLIESE
ncbi:hypothetical protein CLV63_113165 [Murinocardiopsis flavida]|uniref:Uncharacterized protein n=1 Tax=Murinocardiopsis flavida TaxID=645275 RepID=A0A2P8DFK6_9ACTN|nr:hypothetical protein CLV63_113165 [Murinocardiopsis flavida]